MTQSRPRAKEKSRLVAQTAFPFSRQLHIDRGVQNLSAGGLSPGRILIGSRCISGQSRSVARTDAMVSHLRKMSLLSREPARAARAERGRHYDVPVDPVIHRADV